MMDDEMGVGFTKHSYNHNDQKRIHYIKLKKQMQREEQIGKQLQNMEIQSESSDSDGKYKKKKKKAEPEPEKPQKKGKKK